MTASASSPLSSPRDHGDVGLARCRRWRSGRATSTHRLITTARPVPSRRRAADSQGSPPAASRTATRFGTGQPFRATTTRPSEIPPSAVPTSWARSAGTPTITWRVDCGARLSAAPRHRDDDDVGQDPDRLGLGATDLGDLGRDPDVDHRALTDRGRQVVAHDAERQLHQLGLACRRRTRSVAAARRPTPDGSRWRPSGGRRLRRGSRPRCPRRESGPGGAPGRPSPAPRRQAGPG